MCFLLYLDAGSQKEVAKATSVCSVPISAVLDLTSKSLLEQLLILPVGSVGPGQSPLRRCWCRDRGKMKSLRNLLLSLLLL